MTPFLRGDLGDYMRKLMNPLNFAILLGLLCAGLHSSVAADVLTLKSGGSAEGILLNPNEDPRTKFVMRLESGGEVTFNADQVSDHLTLTVAQRRYQNLVEKMKASKFAGTAEGNWRLAEWCQDKGLRDERALHLEAAIGLDPEHEKARRALGYSRLDGEWIKQKDFMAKQGRVIHEGRWRLPQEVEIDKKRRANDLAQKKWRSDIKRWRGWLGKRKNDEAITNFQNIKDPMAAPALATALSNESAPKVRHLYVSALAKLQSTAATKALVNVVLTTRIQHPNRGDLDLRDKALAGLERNGRELAVDAFINSLGSKDNAVVKRAGYALQQMPEERSTRPLINALQTKHTYKIGKDNPGQISTSFGGSGSGGGGIGLGSGGSAKTVTEVVNNREVLDALLAITEGAHAEFQFNQELWRRWMATRDLPPVVDLRRGS